MRHRPRRAATPAGRPAPTGRDAPPNTQQTMSRHSVVVDHIAKSYGRVKAVGNLSLDVGRGELFGIIGPDGAGKTTLFRILATLMLPDSGRATVGGLDVVADYRAVRGIIGYMPGRFSLYPDLTVEENLEFFATVFGTTVEANRHLVDDIYRQIEPFRKRPAGKLSGGMKQKLALSCALIHKPEVLLLDEPTTGVDPVSRKEFWAMLLKLRNEGITILVSTPYMDEATLCDRIALVKDGSLLGTDTPGGIVGRYPTALYAVRSADMHRLMADLAGYPGAASAFSFGDAFHVTLAPGTAPADLQSHLAALGHKAVCIEQTAPTVEDCFMLLSQKEE